MSNRHLLLAGVAVLTLSLTSCGGSKSMYRGDPAHTGMSDSSGPKVLTKLKWKFKAGDKAYSSPVALDQEVLLGSKDGYLYAVDINTGIEKWKFRTDGNVESTPAVVDNVVYVGSWDNHLYAFDLETQSTRWKFRTLPNPAEPPDPASVACVATGSPRPSRSRTVSRTLAGFSFG